MDYDIVLQERITTIPQSYVKSPGSLILDKLSLEKPCPNSSYQSLSAPSLQMLLEEFRFKSETHLQLADDIDEKESDLPTSSIGYKVKQYSLIDLDSNPGKIKKSSDEDAELTKLSQKLLSLFDISLKIKTSSSQSKKVHSILKFLIPEICLFPSQFFKKLNITQLIFSEGEESGQTASFSIFSLDTQSKVLDRFYQIIFMHILQQNPEKNKEYSNEAIEKSFLAIMKNSYSILLKKQIGELKKWLHIQYPELSEEWFQTRNKEKKKMARVCFVLDNSSR